LLPDIESEKCESDSQESHIVRQQPGGADNGISAGVSNRHLEFCVPRDLQLARRVIDAGLRPNHPWEEPAIFVDEILVDIRAHP
jgi:hypothetical protein